MEAPWSAACFAISRTRHPRESGRRATSSSSTRSRRSS